MSTRVLVVEDDADIQQLVVTRLQVDGYEVAAVSSGEDARHLLAPDGVDGFDLAVVDHSLPGLSGLDLVRLLHSEGRCPPVLMITGHGEELSQRTALASGTDDYLTKPFSPRELSARVAALLARRQRAEPRDGARHR